MKKSKTYQLTISAQQAYVIHRALDLFARIHMGQLEEIRHLWMGRISPLSFDEVVLTLDKLKSLLTGMPSSANHGITSPKIPDEARVAFDIYQVVRHRLAWDRKPEGGTGVDFYPPHQTGAESLATFEQEGE